MSSRLATDAEVERWRSDGWVVLEGLVSTEEIDAASADLQLRFPSNEAYHADPIGVTEERIGHPVPAKEEFEWPADGPGFRPEQQRWMAAFPFGGTGALDRLCVHPSIVDFAERALGSIELRLYQAHADREVLRPHQLRTADAHRPQPLVAPRRRLRALVEPHRLPLPHRRRRGREPDQAGVGTGQRRGRLALPGHPSADGPDPL